MLDSSNEGGECSSAHTLHSRIIVAIGSTAHACSHAFLLQERLIALAGVGTPTIGVMEQPSFWMATSECHVQSLCDQGCILDRCHRPSYHHSREQIKHNCKKEPSFSRPDVRRICHPFLVGGVSTKVTLEKVRSHLCHLLTFR